LSNQLITELEIKEQLKKDSQKEQQEADVPIINPGSFGDHLLLTQGNG
jgi:clathrin heavy chain